MYKSHFMRYLFCVFTIASYISPVYAITVNDKDWRPLTETLDVSYNQLDAIYDTATGHIDTTTHTIDGVDYQGWTWASQGEVAELFSAITGSTINSGSPSYNEDDSSWAPAYVSLLGATRIRSEFNASIGVTRTIKPNSFYPYIPNIYDYNSTVTTFDTARIGDIIGSKNSSLGDVGVWLYKPASQVPLPAAVWLFGSGLLGLIGMARRKKSA